MSEPRDWPSTDFCVACKLRVLVTFLSGCKFQMKKQYFVACENYVTAKFSVLTLCGTWPRPIVWLRPLLWQSGPRRLKSVMQAFSGQASAS